MVSDYDDIDKDKSKFYPQRRPFKEYNIIFDSDEIPLCNISNTRDCVSSYFQTLRRELKI